MKSSRRVITRAASPVAAAAGMVVVMVLAAGVGCTPRSDSSTSAATAAHMEAMRAQMAAMERALADATNRPTPVSQPAAAPEVTAAEMRRLRERVDELEDRMLTPRDIEAMQLAIDNISTTIKALNASGSELQTRYEALLKSAASREDLNSGLASLEARIVEHATRLSTMETDLAARLGDLITRMSQMTSPSGGPAMAELQNRLTAAEAARAEAERRLADAQRANEDQKKKIQELQLQLKRVEDELATARGTEQGPAVQPTNPAPNAVAGGAVMGEVLQVLAKGGQREVTAMVRFPNGVEFVEGAQYNVFDREGRKTGDFVVVSNSTPPGRTNEQWFGGYIRLMRADVVPMEKDRVTNLVKVPNLAAVPGDGGSGNTNGGTNGGGDGR